MGWASMRDRMLRTTVAALNDGCATYQDPAGSVPIGGVEVLVDYNLQMAGAEGLFITDQVGITWRKASLPSTGRGGIFTHCGKRYVIENVIADDGHMITAACMVAT
jgi:hypothetical protein